MATISTSHNPRTRHLLRLTGSGAECSPRTYCLYSSNESNDSLDLAEGGVVHERMKYRVSFLTEEDLGPIRLALRVNGEETFRARAIKYTGGKVPYEGGDYFSYSLSFDNEIDAALFWMTYGFASIEVTISTSTGQMISLWTKDIPCVCEHEGQRRSVEGMISELAEGAGSKAMEWMLTPICEEKSRLAIIEGTNISDSTHSLRAFLSLCESVINAYETNASFFRSRAYCRAIKREEIVPIRSVRKLGRQELSWIARSPEVVHATSAKTALSINGKNFLATEVQTERVRKSHNNLENRAIYSFILEVSKSLSRVIEAVKSEMYRLETIAEKLKAIDLDGGLLPSLVVVESCLGHEGPLSAKAADLKRRANGIARMLSQAMPEVDNVRYRLPRRTKIFQEVRPYRDIYAQMLRWSDFGDFDLLRDGLALSTWRMDKLYEYYVLFKLLDQIGSCGFAPSADEELPIRSVAYGLESRFYSDEIQVANFYSLQRGQQHLTLLYEPVIYGDRRDEASTGLHRATKADPFDDGSPDSYWRPDYLVTIDVPGHSARYVFDAKFRSVQDVKAGQRGASEFDKCLIKYKIALASDHGPVDAVWLICGRGMTEQICVYENSSWASESKLKPDGITVLGPGVGKLDDMFELLDLSTGDTSDSSDEPSESLVANQSNQGLPAPNGPLKVGRVPEAREPHVSYLDNALTANNKVSLESKELASRGSSEESPAESAVNTDTTKNGGEDQSAPTSSSKPEEALAAEKPKTRTNTKQSRRRKTVDPDILEQIRYVCAYTLDKQNLLSSRSAYDSFGLERPLLRSSKPSGREAQFYTSEKILIDGAEYYVCLSWNAVQKIRLAKLVNSLEQQAGQSEAHRRVTTEETEKPSEEAEPEYCNLVRRLYRATTNKDQLFEKAHSHDTYGINGALIAHKLPKGKDVQSYRTILLDDEQLYIYAKWKPFNTMKLKNAVNRAEKGKK